MKHVTPAPRGRDFSVLLVIGSCLSLLVPGASAAKMLNWIYEQ
jgi:hypothetical protein